MHLDYIDDSGKTWLLKQKILYSDFQVKVLRRNKDRINFSLAGMFLPESLCDMLCVILGLGKYFARACLISLKLGSNRHFGVNNFPVKNKLKT